MCSLLTLLCFPTPFCFLALFARARRGTPLSSSLDAMKHIKGMLSRRANGATSGTAAGDTAGPTSAGEGVRRSGPGGQTSARAAGTRQRGQPAAVPGHVDDEEEAAAAAEAEAAWLADNARMGAMGDVQGRSRAGSRSARGTPGSRNHVDKPTPRDPDIPEWTMRDISIPEDDDGAHAQPSAGMSGRGHDDANAPRDAERECVICQEHKNSRWRALPCAHVFHDDCVQEWLRQKPSCPVPSCHALLCCPSISRC